MDPRKDPAEDLRRQDRRGPEDVDENDQLANMIEAARHIAFMLNSARHPTPHSDFGRSFFVPVRFLRG
jgi:hypothetical protein